MNRLLSLKGALASLTLLLIVASIVVFVGGRTTYDQAIDAGRQIAAVQEMEELFPSTTHFISYFTGELGVPSWTSKAPLYGRYILELRIDPIRFSRRGGQLIEHGNPRFYLYDLEDIEFRPGGQVQTGHKIVRNFGAPDWRRVVEADGDWSVIGVELKRDDPIDGFDQVWQR